MFVRLHERERELGVVLDALAAAAGGRGGAVVLEGPAGIGKTALLERAAEAARDRSFAAAAARGTELEEAYAWGIVRQLFEPRLRGMSAATRARTLAGAAALAGPVVLPDAAADPEASFGVLHGLYWLVAGLAEQRPQLLVVDDLHWSDGASARFLEFLVNRLDTLPVLLLAAERTGGALRAAPLVTSIRLPALSPAGTAAMLAERDGAPVPEAFAEACHGATGGNPLLVRRLADGLLHERGAADAEAVTRLGPYVVADAVAASLARLGDGPGALARAVAVLETAPLATAARLAGSAPTSPRRSASSSCGPGSCATHGHCASSTRLCATPSWRGCRRASARCCMPARRASWARAARPRRPWRCTSCTPSRAPMRRSRRRSPRWAAARCARAPRTRPRPAWRAPSPSRRRPRSGRRSCWTSRAPSTPPAAPSRCSMCWRRRRPRPTRCSARTPRWR